VGDEDGKDLLNELSHENPENEQNPLDYNRYNYLKSMANSARRLRYMGINDSDSEFNNEERQEYQNLFEKYGANDSDPEALPPPPEVEGEGEGEAE